MKVVGFLLNKQQNSFTSFLAFQFSSVQFSLVQLLSRVWLFVTPWIAARQALSITNSLSLLNSCPLSQRCHPTISSSVIPFSSHLQSFLASQPFQMSQFFASGTQSIEFSASASVVPMNIQDWFLQDWLVWSPCSPGNSQEFSLAPQFENIKRECTIFIW